MRRLIVASLLVTATLAAQPPFSADAIRAHMRFLASDLLEGRGTATRGYFIAAEYVVAQLQSYGLETSYQTVPFRKTVAGDASTLTFTRDGKSTTLNYGEGFITAGDPLSDDKTVEGDVVFAGFGITAPEQHHDDYAGLDVNGKVVVIVNGAQKSFTNALRAHYSSSLMKIETAAAHGAAGLILVSAPKDYERSPWARVVRQSRLGAMHWLDASGAPHAVNPRISFTSGLNKESMEALFGSTPFDPDAPKPAPLPVHAKIHVVSTHDRVESPNVVGILRGSDPKLREEYVVYSAHLDHLGISTPVDGDAINNGALDNASGIAAMLEVARAFASQPQRPRRSILFLATTGEEKGLRGADYFANNPTVPAAQLVADINIDEIQMLAPTRDFVAIGAETNDLGDVAANVAKQMNIELSPDPFPEEVVFVRSDQYPFVKTGVPSIYIGVGYKGTTPGSDPAKLQEEWIKTIYHTQKDDMSQTLDYPTASKLARFDYEIGAQVANATARPRWKPGDFFGEKFGRR